MGRTPQNPFESARAYKLDDALSEVCDLVEIEKWNRILEALDGKAPRYKTSEARGLRKVRDLASGFDQKVVSWQRGLVAGEIKLEGGRPVKQRDHREPIVIDLRS